MMRRIVVVGAGIAGLAAAHRLIELKQAQSLDLEILLLEASARLGGAIATERVGDFLIEGGPDSFISEKPWALKLCERLGLSSRLLSTQPAYQKIYVVHKGVLEALPEGFFLLAPTRFWPFIQTPLFSWPGKLRVASELLLPRRDSSADESLGSFVRRRFGAEALEPVAQPLVGGIYASDPDRLSLRATMPRFLEMERKQRSIIYAMWSAARRRRREAGSGARWSLFVTMAGGMGELVDAIAERLPQDCIRLESTVEALDFEDQKQNWRIKFDRSETIEAGAVIIATPAYGTAAMLRSVAPAAAAHLQKITYSSTATVSLAYKRADFPQPPDSFGFVVPEIEKRKIMACTFSSLKYPGRAPTDAILLRAFVGGSFKPELVNDDDRTLERNVRGEIADLLGVRAEPVLSRIWRHPNSMPQYHVGHEDRVASIKAALGDFPTLALAGSAYSGVGISDCIRSGEEAAEAVIKRQ
jgi:protoporphyrinogen/coproporphyrinogen III oxidase